MSLYYNPTIFIKQILQKRELLCRKSYEVHLFCQHRTGCVDEKDATEKATLLCGFFAYSATKQAKIEEKSQVFQKQGA